MQLGNRAAVMVKESTAELEQLLATVPEERSKYLRVLAAELGEEVVLRSLRSEDEPRQETVIPAHTVPLSLTESADVTLKKDYKARAEEARAREKAMRPKHRMTRYEGLKLYERASVIPNLAAKAMLFAPVKPGRRRFVREYTPVPVWGLDDVEVSYKHEQLNQLDLNVFLMLVNFAKRRGDPYRAAFTRREALRFLRLNDSGKSYINLDSIIDRLGSTRVQVAVLGQDDHGQDRRYVMRDALAPRDYQESVSGKYVVELSKTLSGFMAVDDWSLVSIEQRLELGQNQWALAIHAFLSSSRPPAWFSWEQIHSLWGQGYAELKKLKYDFKKRVIKPLYDINFLTKVEEKDTAIGMWW